MNSKIVFFFMIMCCCSVTLFSQKNTGKKQTSTNPVFDGWYADPEGVVFGDKYWIYYTGRNIRKSFLSKISAG